MNNALSYCHRALKSDSFVALFVVFVVKQAWACLFGGALLAGMIFSSYIDLPFLSRYDWLFIYAILLQALLLLFKLEQPKEVRIIALFHLTGLVMEIFKTSGAIGSWTYPEEAFFQLGNVPLFSGFMYASVGSYIARASRVLDLEFSKYPNKHMSVVLAVLIYLNFFFHHFIYDFRYFLFLFIIMLYYKTTVRFTLAKTSHKMPLLLGMVLISFFIWVGENVGTFTGVWLYPSQIGEWHFVSLHKMGAWLLLMTISFVMVETTMNLSGKSNKKQ